MHIYIYMAIFSIKVNEGSVVLARDKEFRSILKRFPIYEEIENDHIPGEGRIYTGYNIPPVITSEQSLSHYIYVCVCIAPIFKFHLQYTEKKIQNEIR